MSDDPLEILQRQHEAELNRMQEELDSALDERNAARQDEDLWRTEALQLKKLIPPKNILSKDDLVKNILNLVSQYEAPSPLAPDVKALREFFDMVQNWTVASEWWCPECHHPDDGHHRKGCKYITLQKKIDSPEVKKSPNLGECWTEGYTNYRAIEMLDGLHLHQMKTNNEHNPEDCHTCWLIKQARSFPAYKVYEKYGQDLSTMGKADRELGRL